MCSMKKLEIFYCKDKNRHNELKQMLLGITNYYMYLNVPIDKIKI